MEVVTDGWPIKSEATPPRPPNNVPLFTQGLDLQEQEPP